MTKDQNGCQFVYDYENRIVKVLDASDTPVATFDYDALSRRIREKGRHPELVPSVVTPAQQLKIMTHGPGVTSVTVVRQ